MDKKKYANKSCKIEITPAEINNILDNEIKKLKRQCILYKEEKEKK